MLDDFLFRGDLASLDPDVAALVDLEKIRQARKLILVPSESTIPEAVREAVGSVLANIYAEGYPPESWRFMEPDELLDTDVRLAEFRRKSTPRYYKGTEIAEMVESLARRRTAERFANDRVSANRIYVNVQPLSGAPANNAVYTALSEYGDKVMGMDLLVGGHLTHGSPVNRSGIMHDMVPYGVRASDEKLDYDRIHDLAVEHRPKFIIAGFTSYPWAVDWNILREIADESGSLILADISHVAGLVIAGMYPSPVGIADVVSFTTHKTLAGPRGAVLLTHRRDIARKLDRAVFPGEQGGPHINSIAALAVAMKLAETEQFHEVQKQTVRNAVAMAERFMERGIRVPYGGTDSHMLLIDTGKIKGADGSPLSGDIAARILDLAGIVANRNTIPGDKSPFKATGVRFGTFWITQRGFKEAQTRQLADAIADLLLACQPFSYATGARLKTWRGKMDFDVFTEVQQRVNRLALRAGIDYEVPSLSRYPKEADAAEEHFRVLPVDDEFEPVWQTIDIYGAQAGRFLDIALTATPSQLARNEWQAMQILDKNGCYLSRGVVEKVRDDVYLLYVDENYDLILQWFKTLSDGFVDFDSTDLPGKVPGPVSISPLPGRDIDMNRFEGLDLDADWKAEGIGIEVDKVYFIGCNGSECPVKSDKELPVFTWQEPENSDLLVTPLHDLHVELGAKMVPFAGYDMPVWYSSVLAEHKATREQAGLFDVSHMGVWELAGSGAEVFLDAVTANDVSTLSPGQAHYSYLLGVDGIPIDDIFVYRRGQENFMVVVNASNNDKDWAWIKAVKAGKVQVDPAHPQVKVPGRDTTTMRDLRNPESGDERRVDLALQGPESLNILQSLDGTDADKAKVKKLKWAELCEVTLGGYHLVISRTGYTGERVAYEIFVHPDRAAGLFKLLVDKGAVPCGLASRDSLRTEAGLPLYGHELAGPLHMNPADAGFSNFVKTWKPFFIGKRAFLKYEATRDVDTVRFQIDAKGLRAPHQGDPIVDSRGRVIGQVCSCATDGEGYQVGLALVKSKYADADTPLLVYAASEKAKPGKALAEAGIGDKVTAPQAARVLSRFPKRRRKK